jgi:acyl dehydratase
MPLQSSDVGTAVPTSTFAWNERDVMLYALSVGASEEDLAFVYEGKGPAVLPTYGVVPAFPALAGMGAVLDFDHAMTLHGAHKITVHGPIPPACEVRTEGRIVDIWDKGANAVIVAAGDTVSSSGEVLFTNEFTAFVRGAGGFGGERGPSGGGAPVPERPADVELRLPTLPTQAMLYRLNGDRNPLHADPEIARMAGFPRPILHGLCTFGIVGRAVLMAMADGDVARFRSFEARFGGVVFPGETIVAKLWDVDGAVRVEATTAERGEPVLVNAAVELG